MKRKDVYTLIDAERAYQDEKWGPNQQNSPLEWNAILGEEVGETANVVLHIHFKGRKAKGDLVKELVQVAAVATAWLESLD